MEVSDFSHRPLWVWALYRSNYLLHFGVYFLYQDTFNLNILCHESWTIRTFDVPRKSVVVRSVDLRVIHGLLSLNLVPQQLKDVLWRNNICRCVQKF